METHSKLAHGMIPEKTSVMTFDSFVYRYIVCPYEPSISEHYGRIGFRSKGITTIEPPTRTIPKKGRTIPNPRYIPKNNLEHYITTGSQYYCATLSELVMSVKSGKDSLIHRAAERLNLFFDQVLIDEFQDFRGYDYELIVGLAKSLNSVLLVGDYYQHSVSAINNSGKPFKNNKGDVVYSAFLSELKRMRFDVDEETLVKSRRCPESICSFVRDRLGINIESMDINHGDLVWVTEETIDSVLKNPAILKLVFNDAAHFTFRALNWSYSKGDTVEAACVILTDSFEELDKAEFSIKSIPISTVNKLYVALTRSKGDLYLIKASMFKKCKERYRLNVD